MQFQSTKDASMNHDAVHLPQAIVFDGGLLFYSTIFHANAGGPNICQLLV